MEFWYFKLLITVGTQKEDDNAKFNCMQMNSDRTQTDLTTE